MAHEILDIPAKSDYEVRLFPLPGTVFFPHNALPLQIFESRYREMFEHAIEGDRLITMATLLPGYEDQYYSRPKISTNVCIGHVKAHERTNDGRFNFILIGLRRAQVLHEIEPVRSYRRAMVQLLEGEDDGTSVADAAADELIQRLEAIALGFENVVKEFRSETISTAALTDVVAFNLPLGLESKLNLLAETDPQARLQMLLRALPEPSKNARGGEFPPRFSGN